MVTVLAIVRAQLGESTGGKELSVLECEYVKSSVSGLYRTITRFSASSESEGY